MNNYDDGISYKQAYLSLMEKYFEYQKQCAIVASENKKLKQQLTDCETSLNDLTKGVWLLSNTLRGVADHE